MACASWARRWEARQLHRWQRDFSIQQLSAPGYTVVNLAANYEVSESLSAFGHIDNLFNVRYQNPTGFLTTGFGSYAGLRARY
jgi:vitamin B12 transporter